MADAPDSKSGLGDTKCGFESHLRYEKRLTPADRGQPFLFGKILKLFLALTNAFAFFFKTIVAMC